MKEEWKTKQPAITVQTLAQHKTIITKKVVLGNIMILL